MTDSEKFVLIPTFSYVKSEPEVSQVLGDPKITKLLAQLSLLNRNRSNRRELGF